MNIPLPQLAGGSETEQLQSMKTYLYQLAQQLQFALGSVEQQSLTAQQTAAAAGKSAQAAADGQTPLSTFANVKALIIKSADIVDAYYEEINRRLSGEYVASSDFGTFREQLVQDITENADGITRAFTSIQTIDTSLTDFGVRFTALEGSAATGVTEEFAVSADPNTVPTGDWSSAQPENRGDSFIWRRLVTTYGDGTVERGEPVCITAAGRDGADAVLLRIESSRGTVFKNSAVSTVLSAVVYKGGERIMDIDALRAAFGAGAYLEWSWQRIDESEYGVIVTDDPMVGADGFTLTVTPDQVDTKVTFKCELKG